MNLSSTSYWLGFLSGILFAWIISRLVIYIPKLIRSLRKNVSSLRENFSTSADARLRNDVYRITQKQHLADMLFSLDEIVIVPKVLTPLIQAVKSIELAPTDSVSLTVPYMPDWPEMAAVYKASTMSLIEAMQGGANIILAGHPGSGKTVALAWLATSIARNDPGLGILEGVLPLYVHATDIYRSIRHVDEILASQENPETQKSAPKGRSGKKTELTSGDAVDTLIDAISTYASPLTLPRLSNIIRTALDKQRAILILDRCDELPPNQASVITVYIQSLLVKFAKLRVITAMSYDNLAELPALGFSLLGMAAWGEDEQNAFLLRWSQNWDKWINPPGKHQSRIIRTQYLNSWLKVENTMLKPLEYVLKVWAAYSGDSLGTDGPSAIEAYIRRMTSDVSKARSGLEGFALHLVNEMSVSANPHDTARIFSELGIGVNPAAVNASDDGTVTPPLQESGKTTRIKELTGIDSLTSSGILVSYAGSQYGFSHPVFSAYLAGNALTYTGAVNHVQSQPAWVGKTLSMYYFARNGDVTPFINELIQEDDILHTNHLMIARWLQIAPKNRQWRSIILRTLTSVLHKEKDTPSLAGKFISGLAFSGDAGVSVLFRQLLKSDQPNLKQLAALGCGILAEKKAIEDLVAMLQADSPASIRAGSLSLGAIGDKQSLEILASTLLNGSELARRYSAEALANNPTEGHPALKDGATMEDLLVRRSVAFGLIRVNQPWAIKIVENMQLEDNEWVVRNAALQAFDEYRRKISYAPKPLGDPTEMDWLINYATRIGTSVAPGKPADKLVVKALVNGNQDEVLNALDYLRIKCDADVISEIYSVYSTKTDEIKDIAYYVLWLMIISGIKLPTAVRYNIE
jgi:HEAT repeat protein